MGLNSIFGPLFVSIVFLFVFILLLFFSVFFLHVRLLRVFNKETVFWCRRVIKSVSTVPAPQIQLQC